MVKHFSKFLLSFIGICVLIVLILTAIIYGIVNYVVPFVIKLSEPYPIIIGVIGIAIFLGIIFGGIIWALEGDKIEAEMEHKEDEKKKPSLDVVKKIISLHKEASKHYDNLIKEQRESCGYSQMAIDLLDDKIDVDNLVLDYIYKKL